MYRSSSSRNRFASRIRSIFFSCKNATSSSSRTRNGSACWNKANLYKRNNENARNLTSSSKTMFFVISRFCSRADLFEDGSPNPRVLLAAGFGYEFKKRMSDKCNATHRSVSYIEVAHDHRIKHNGATTKINLSSLQQRSRCSACNKRRAQKCDSIQNIMGETIILPQAEKSKFKPCGVILFAVAS